MAEPIHSEDRTVTVTFKVTTEGDTAVQRSAQAVALVKNLLANTKLYLGVDITATEDDTRCDAILWCGPGHQSKRLCEVTGPHELHYVDSAGHYAEWTGDETYE